MFCPNRSRRVSSGIPSRGAPLAHRLAALIGEAEGVEAAREQQAERPAVRGTVPLAPQEQQPRRQQDLPTVVEPDLGAGSSDLDVPDFLK